MWQLNWAVWKQICSYGTSFFKTDIFQTKRYWFLWFYFILYTTYTMTYLDICLISLVLLSFRFLIFTSVHGYCDEPNWVNTFFSNASKAVICTDSDIKRVLTSERGGFIGSKSIVLLGKESPSGARCTAAKQACWSATRCTKSKTCAGGGSCWLTECTGSKQTACWKESRDRLQNIYL